MCLHFSFVRSFAVGKEKKRKNRFVLTLSVTNNFPLQLHYSTFGIYYYYYYHSSQLEPLLLDAVKDMLPRLHGSSISGNAINGNVVVNDESILENGPSSAEVVEVASLIVRNGSGHQSVHGDYRRFRDNDDNDDDHVVVKKEESIQNTNSRIGKMPPRIVVFVALQDIPSNEYGATGFITGTHNSKAHGLIYGRDGGIDNNNNNNNSNNHSFSHDNMNKSQF